MKNIFLKYALAVSALMAGFTSCTPDGPEGEEPGTKVEPNFPQEVVNETVEAGATVELAFEPNMDWKVEISGEGSGTMFWLDDAGMKATSISGKETGPQVVVIEFSDKEEFDVNRVCEVVLTMGEDSRKIAVYTRPSLNRTFELYTGITGEFGYEKNAGAYVYSESTVSEAVLGTFLGDVTYTLPVKVVSNYAWNIALPSWISSDVMEGKAGVTELYLTAVLSKELAAGKEDVIKFVDAANSEAFNELAVSLPAFGDRIEYTLQTTFNFDINGLVENLNGSFIEIPAVFELLSTPETQVRILDWNEKSQSYAAEFAQWPELTKILYDTFEEGDLLAKYSVEIKVGVNDTFDDRCADIFVIPASMSSVDLNDWFDASTGQLKEEFASCIIGRLTQPGIHREYITLSDEEAELPYEAELAKYTEAPWWSNTLSTENLFELVYKNEYSDAVLIFDEPFASFKYFDYDFREVAEDAAADFWLSFNGFASNGKGRVTMYPEKFTRADAEYPESFIVFYDEEGTVLGAVSVRYTSKSSVIEGEVISIESGNGELVLLGEDSELKQFLSSEYGQMGVLDVYQFSTSDKSVVLSSQIESWGHKILRAEPPFGEYTDAPFAFENQATVFALAMQSDVEEPVEAIILLQTVGADNVSMLNYAAIHYVYTPGEDSGEAGDVPVGNPEIDQTSEKMYSIGAGSGELIKYAPASEKYAAINEKFALSEVYHFTSGDKKVFLSGTVEVSGILVLDPETLEEVSLPKGIVCEGSDSGFYLYMKASEVVNTLLLVQGAEADIAAVYVTFDPSMEIDSPFSFVNPEAVEGKATLGRYTGELLASLLADFGGQGFDSIDERNIYELKYSDVSVSAEITIPSNPAFNAAWGNESSDSSYWLTHKASGKKMTVTMKQSGKTDYFVFKTSDGNWAWILVCTCE